MSEVSCRHTKKNKTLDCNYVKLRSFDIREISNQSMEIQNLLLVDTGLEKINDNSFDLVPNLLHLNVSSNSIETLGSRLFSSLTKLRVLDLSNNKLKSLHDKSLFKSQGDLSILILSNNELRTLDSDVLTALTSISSLALAGNPFTCNCDLGFTVRWCRQKGLTTNATCEFPLAYQGTAWSVPNYSEICKENETSKVNPSGYVPTTEQNVEEPTTAQGNDAVPVWRLVVCVHVAILLLCVAMVTSAHCCRKFKYLGKSTHNFHYENTEKCSENNARLSVPPFPPKRPSLNETSRKEQLQISNESQRYNCVECDPAVTGVPRTTENYSCHGKCSMDSEVSAERRTEKVDTEISHKNSLYIQTQA